MQLQIIFVMLREKKRSKIVRLGAHYAWALNSNSIRKLYEYSIVLSVSMCEHVLFLMQFTRLFSAHATATHIPM